MLFKNPIWASWFGSKRPSMCRKFLSILTTRVISWFHSSRKTDGNPSTVLGQCDEQEAWAVKTGEREKERGTPS
jgi:hypothetical protein